jgi:glycosyltransferase involved in cell wall biosynthesis
MRVLHVQKAKGIGGSERHLLALLPALAAHGIEPTMCVLVEGGGDRFVEALRALGVDTIPTPSGADIDPRTISRVVRIVRQHRPDLVHTHLVHGDLYGQLAATLLRVPSVASMHGAPAFYHRLPYRMVGRVVGRLADRRIAISRFVADFIREHHLAPPDRIRLVYYGINADDWQVAPDRRERLRTAWGVTDDVVIGMASRLIAGKGHANLIEAVARVAGNAKVRLVIAGDGPLDGDLKRLADTSCPPETVTFVGFVNDTPAFMAACDIVTVPTEPTLSEGFGLAALEAMAVGRPVLVTDVGSLPEVVGAGGVVVPSGSPQQLAEAIVALARDPVLRRQLGETGTERARNEFSLERMVAGTAAVYREAMS